MHSYKGTLYGSIEANLVPARYDLGVKGKADLIIKVHQTTMLELGPQIRRASPEIEGLQKKFGIPKFISPAEMRWGFGNVLARTGREGRFVLIECPLPAFKLSQRECNAVSATLQVLFLALARSQTETDSKLPQLISVGRIGPEIGIRLEIGKGIVPWLSKQRDKSHITRVDSAMRSAFEHMIGRLSRDDRRETYAVFNQPKWVDFACQGDRSGLSPINHYDKTTDGYSLPPHNVDEVYQQLTLLVGAAAMYQLARENGY